MATREVKIEQVQGLQAALDAAAATGGSSLTPISVTADYTAEDGDFVLVNAATAPVDITLPNAPTDGTEIGIKKIDATANVVNILTQGGSLIEGDPNGSIIARHAGAVLMSYGNNWYVKQPTRDAATEGEAVGVFLGPDAPTAYASEETLFNRDEQTTLPSPWTWANQPGSTSYREVGGVATILYPSAQTAVQIIGIERPLTGDSLWEYTCRIGLTTTGQNFYEMNMFLRDSTGGRAVSFSMDGRGPTEKRWTNVTTWNSEDSFGVVVPGWPSPNSLFLRMKKTASNNVDFLFSGDGINYTKVQATDLSWLTTAPNRIGWGASISTTAHPDGSIRCERFWRSG